MSNTVNPGCRSLKLSLFVLQLDRRLLLRRIHEAAWYCGVTVPTQFRDIDRISGKVCPPQVLKGRAGSIHCYTLKMLSHASKLSILLVAAVAVAGRSRVLKSTAEALSTCSSSRV